MVKVLEFLNFFEGYVFHKFYLVHSWIPCSKCVNLCEFASPTFHPFLPATVFALFCSCQYIEFVFVKASLYSKNKANLNN